MMMVLAGKMPSSWDEARWVVPGVVMWHYASITRGRIICFTWYCGGLEPLKVKPHLAIGRRHPLVAWTIGTGFLFGLMPIFKCWHSGVPMRPVLWGVLCAPVTSWLSFPSVKRSSSPMGLGSHPRDFIEPWPLPTCPISEQSHWR